MSKGVSVKKSIVTKEQRQKIIDDFKNNIAGDVKIVDAEKYCRADMIVYGMNVSVMRQFIRLEDGLKPVVKRLLWTMYHDHDLSPEKRLVKVPEFLGHTSKYHPHGDIGDTFDGLARPWENNCPLIEIHGNRGSLSGEGPAAPRYLDARLSDYAWKCFFEDFDQDTTDMTENYIRSDVEPVFLPARYPNFLMNTGSGIGWGYSPSYPPFNLTEAFRLTQALIKNPEMTNVYLFPDSPRGYNLIDDGTIVETCETGAGNIRGEAVVEYIEDEHALYVTGLPEKIMFDSVMTKIAQCVRDKKISGIDNMADTSTLEVSSFMIELKKGANPYQVIDELFSSNVGLRASVSIRFWFAERTSLSHYGLREAILEWIDRRVVQKQKFYIKKLGQFQQRKHALTGVIPLLEDPKKYEKIMDIIRHGETDDEIIEELRKKFPLTSSQCMMLIDMRLRDSNKNRIRNLKVELDKLIEKSDEYRRIASSKENIKETIWMDLEEGIQLFGKPRCCNIIKEGEQDRPELFYRIVITKRYVKKLSVGGKQPGLVSSDDDIIGYYPEVSENDALMVVDDLGKVYRLQVKRLPSSDMSSKGAEMATVIGLKGAAIRSILVNKEMLSRSNDIVLSMFTENGIIKSSPISQYITNKTELQGILLNPGDKICWAFVYDMTNNDKNQLLVYTKDGFGISINMETVTIQDRLTKGTQHLKLEDGDVVKSIAQLSLDDDVFVLTSKGYGKVCELASIFEASKRKQDMIRITSLHDGDDVFRIIPIDKEHTSVTVYLQSGEKKELLLKDVEKLPRLSKGKKLVPVRQGDSIYRIKIN